jgi:hypothetical protein
MNTLFNIPETTLLSEVVHMFDSNKGFKVVKDGTGLFKDSTFISYDSIFNDVRAAVDRVHNTVSVAAARLVFQRNFFASSRFLPCLTTPFRPTLLPDVALVSFPQGKLKNEIVAHMDKYVRKEPRLPLLLSRLRRHGRGVFLVTNSDFSYTKKIMDFLFDLPSQDVRFSPRKWSGCKAYESLFPIAVRVWPVKNERAIILIHILIPLLTFAHRALMITRAGSTILTSSSSPRKSRLFSKMDSVPPSARLTR